MMVTTPRIALISFVLAVAVIALPHHSAKHDNHDHHHHKVKLSQHTQSHKRHLHKLEQTKEEIEGDITAIQKMGAKLVDASHTGDFAAGFMMPFAFWFATTSDNFFREMVADNNIGGIVGMIKGAAKLRFSNIDAVAVHFANTKDQLTLHGLWIMLQTGIITGKDVENAPLFTIPGDIHTATVGSIEPKAEYDDYLKAEKAFDDGLLAQRQKVIDLLPNFDTANSASVDAVVQEISKLRTLWNQNLDKRCPSSGGEWGRRFPTFLTRVVMSRDLGFDLMSDEVQTWASSGYTKNNANYDLQFLAAAGTSKQYPLMAEAARDLHAYAQTVPLATAWNKKLFYHSSEHAVLFANVMARVIGGIVNEAPNTAPASSPLSRAAIFAAMFHDVGYGLEGVGDAGTGHELLSLRALLDRYSKDDDGIKKWTTKQHLVAIYVIAATKVTFLASPAKTDVASSATVTGTTSTPPEIEREPRTAKHILASEIDTFILGTHTEESIQATYDKTLNAASLDSQTAGLASAIHGLVPKPDPPKE